MVREGGSLCLLRAVVVRNGAPVSSRGLADARNGGGQGRLDPRRPRAGHALVEAGFCDLPGNASDKFWNEQRVRLMVRSKDPRESRRRAESPA